MHSEKEEKLSLNVYTKLREHLDELPAGFPATETGVEIRILKRLFDPAEAELARHVTMKLEPASAIALRARVDEKKAGKC